MNQFFIQDFKLGNGNSKLLQFTDTNKLFSKNRNKNIQTKLGAS